MWKSTIQAMTYQQSQKPKPKEQNQKGKLKESSHVIHAKECSIQDLD